MGRREYLDVSTHKMCQIHPNQISDKKRRKYSYPPPYSPSYPPSPAPEPEVALPPSPDYHDPAPPPTSYPGGVAPPDVPRTSYHDPITPPLTSYPDHVPTPYYPGSDNTTAYTPAPGGSHGHHHVVLVAVLVPIAGLLFLGLLAGLCFMFVRRRRRRMEPQPECPPPAPEEEAATYVEVSEHVVRVQEEVVVGPEGEVVVIDVVDEVLEVRQEHAGGGVRRAHGDEGPPY